MSKMIQIGAAWNKRTQNGNEYISVNITQPFGPDIRLTIWPNGYKKGDNSPDMIVYKSGEENAQARPSGANMRPQATGRTNAEYIPPADDTGGGEFPDDNGADDGDVPF